MFVQNAWYVGARIAEVTDTPFVRTILNEPVVFARGRDGALFALEDRCCHRAAPLSIGTMTEKGLQCRYHGFTYDASGACVVMPGHDGKIPERARVRTYPVAAKGDFVWIWMGDPARADAVDIVDYPPAALGLRNESGLLHANGSYVLLCENLMDLTHLTYLHPSSIGASPADAAGAKMEVTRTQKGVKFIRTMLNAVTAPAFRKNYALGEFCDRWSYWEYVGPSLVLQHNVLTEAGELDMALEHGIAKVGRGGDNRLLHACTPETETSCHYFFTKADAYELIAPAGYKRVDSGKVFEEDVWMVEHQQSRLTGYDASRLVDGPSDVARLQMNRALGEMLAADRALREGPRAAAE